MQLPQNRGGRRPVIVATRPGPPRTCGKSRSGAHNSLRQEEQAPPTGFRPRGSWNLGPRNAGQHDGIAREDQPAETPPRGERRGCNEKGATRWVTRQRARGRVAEVSARGRHNAIRERSLGAPLLTRLQRRGLLQALHWPGARTAQQCVGTAGRTVEAVGCGGYASAST